MFFILTLGIPSVNRIDLRALTLAGPNGTSPVLDPLDVDVLRIDNQLCMLFTILKTKCCILFTVKLPHILSYPN